MNTVDALNVLGKALCGDSFEVKPGLTDAETILEIAKNYTGGSGSGGSGGKIVVDASDEDNPVVAPIAPGLTMEELAKYQVVAVARQMDYIVPPSTINASEGSSVVIMKTRYPEAGESVRITYKTSDSVNTYIATANSAGYPGEFAIEFEKGVIRFSDRSNTFTAAADDGQVTITVVKNQPGEPFTLGVANNISVIPYGESDASTFIVFYTIGLGDAKALSYNRSTGEIIANI